MGVIVKGKTFRSGNSQAVRLPKAVAFDDDVELRIERNGDVVTLTAAPKPIQLLIDRLAALPQPSDIEERDIEEIPERPGL